MRSSRLRSTNPCDRPTAELPARVEDASRSLRAKRRTPPRLAAKPQTPRVHRRRTLQSVPAAEAEPAVAEAEPERRIRPVRKRLVAVGIGRIAVGVRGVAVG